MTTKTNRNFGLSTGEVKALQEQHAADQKFPNPYHQGCYHFIVAALVNLGIDQPHPFQAVYSRFQKEAGRQWFKDWAGREGRTETAKDARGRFVQNLKVLQRTKDYGKKLLEVGRRVLKSKGVVIDLSHGTDGALMVALNSNSNKPQKAGRAKKAAVTPGQVGTVGET